MSNKEMLNFPEIYIEKCKFQASKGIIDINDVDIEHILILNKYSIRKNILSISLVKQVILMMA